MVIHAKLIQEVFKVGVRYASRYYKVEGKAFDKLYRGFPQNRDVARGVRHGLTVGSAVGSLITGGEDTPGNGVPQAFEQRKRSKAGKSYQTRSRRSGRNRSRCPTGRRFNRKY